MASMQFLNGFIAIKLIRNIEIDDMNRANERYFRVICGTCEAKFEPTDPARWLTAQKDYYLITETVEFTRLNFICNVLSF